MIRDIESVAAFLEQVVQEFTDVAVVGVSGGVDSSLVASICVQALGAKNVYLISMPFDDIDRNTFNSRSAALAESLEAHHFEVSIQDACQAIQRDVEQIFSGAELTQLTPANIRPRVRMNVLYSIAGEIGYREGRRARVMGTGQMSEDLIGYDTKGGDSMCDIFILSDLLKSEVYQLAEHYKVPKSILDAPPSAGLYPGQTDESELGYSYDVLEAPTLAVHNALKSGISLDQLSPDLPVFQELERETLQFVISRCQAHYHKRLAPVTVEVRRPEWFS